MVLKAIKGARVYDIDESAINDFVGRGFEIYEDGELKYGESVDKVSKEEYEKVLDDLKKANAEIKKLKEAKE
ncbi:hypothetical protein QP439_04755 [Streptococcus sp. UMB1203]|uniref:hypothetical protein n=1 Tax=Streptococcus sp. UMB1203 TaxID=3046327 RepID=UPI0025524E0E|nr:hypothetical protein [Streptococcus sp. UMB1203]MDK7203625.1 hypothetical protein [Streptococcus sp. UMB1203]